MAERQQDIRKGPACSIDRQSLIETAQMGAQFFGNASYKHYLESAQRATSVNLHMEAGVFSSAAAKLRQSMLDEGYADPAESLPKVVTPTT